MYAHTNTHIVIYTYIFSPVGTKTEEKRSYISLPKMFMADLEKNYQLVSTNNLTINYIPTLPIIQ